MRFPLGLIPVIAALLLAACAPYREAALPIDLSTTVALPAEPLRRDQAPIRVAVAAVISPRETKVTYTELMEYLGVKLGRPVLLVQRPTYGEVNELLRQGDVDLALVCTLAYVAGKDQFGMELVAAPQVNGEALYYSYLLVPATSTATKLADLEGGTFAFTDPLSTTGRLVPEYWIRQMGRRSEEFFRKSIFTYSHDRAVRAVADRLVDGAAVDHLVYEAMLEQDPALAAKVRVIQKSRPIGSPPVVINPRVDPVVKRTIADLFLSMDQDPAGAAIMRKLRIERWVQPPESAYAPVREMLRLVGGP